MRLDWDRVAAYDSGTCTYPLSVVAPTHYGGEPFSFPAVGKLPLV